MPRKKAASNGNDYKLPKFVSCTLSSEEVQEVQANLLDAAGVGEFLITVLDLGYKLSIGYDAYNDCTIVTATLPKSDKVPEALALSSRGPGVFEALSICAYKLVHKLDGDISAGSVETKRDMWG